MHSYITVSIKEDSFPKNLRSKALIFSTVDGKSKYAEGGKWNGNTMSVKTRSFGGYGIAVDTIAPRIIPINISNGSYMGNKWSISLKVTDEFSGLDEYKGTIDGKWVLFEYDAKRNLLSYYFDENIKKGSHLLEFTATDAVGNIKIFKANFRR